MCQCVDIFFKYIWLSVKLLTLQNYCGVIIFSGIFTLLEDPNISCPPQSLTVSIL